MLERLDGNLPEAGSEATLVSGLLHAVAGDEVHAAQQLQEALSGFRQRGPLDLYTETAGALARLHLTAGRVDDALAVSKDPTGIIIRKEIWLWAGSQSPGTKAWRVASSSSARACR
jgi:hypothetical protein